MKVKILDERSIPSGDPERVGRFDTLVTYQIDPLRTYVVVIPKEKFSDEAMKEAIQKDMAAREKIVGREIEV